MQPLVSVLMTAYNREKYIAAAIESVVQSTYPNWELIITDDRSTDRTVEIARDFAAADPRIKVYVNDINLGDYPNRNKAASYASGKYLKYVDADDYIYPTGLQVLVSMMEANPQAGWGLCSFQQVIPQPYPLLLQPREAYLHNFFGPGLFHKAPLSSILKKDVFDAVGGFQPLRMIGDFEMWLRLALSYPVLLMPDGIVWYRIHGEQEIKSRLDFLVDYRKIEKAYLNHKSCPLNEDEVRTVLSRQKKDTYKRLLRSLLRSRRKEVKVYFKQAKLYSDI